MKSRFYLGLMLIAALSAHPAQAAGRPHFYGINLAGADFGSGKFPGVFDKDYTWPKPADIDSYADMGANMVRIPFRWERMQPALNEQLDAKELARLDAVVIEAAARHVTVLLDVHNYGAYKNDLIGSENVPAAAFADLWTRLATHYKDTPNVAFGLMNEPNKQSPEAWAALAQQAIKAIRATGARQLIAVPGTAWTGAHSWVSSGNAAALASLTDPAHHFVFEAHQYFDADSSGTKPECVSADIGAQRLAGMTAWLRQTHHQALLGEFGASKDPVCVEALKRTLKYMADNNDVWYGWTYWVAAAWFGNYMFNVYPPDPDKFPQVPVLEEAMKAK